MSFLIRFFGIVIPVGLLALTGCMVDTPPDDDIPWNTPDERDGMIPLPSSTLNRYN